MATTTNYGQTLPTVGSDDGLWGGYNNTLHSFWDSQLVTRTLDYNFADYKLQRPIIKDYGEVLNALGNVTGTATADITLGNHCSMTLTGNTTLTISNPTATGNFCLLALYVSQDGTGGRILTFPAACKNTAGTTFSISGTTASKMTEVFMYTLDAGTTWRCKQGDTW